MGWDTWTPEPPCGVDGVPFQVYLEGPGLSCSGLSELARSALHFATREHKDPTNRMRRGSVLHAMVMEPGEVPHRYLFAGALPSGRKAKDEEIARLEEKAEREGKELILESEKRLWACARAAREFPAFKAAADPARSPAIERSIYWTDEETGVLLRVRPDSLDLSHEAHAIVTDLKFPEDASLAAFKREGARRRNDIRAAMYVEGVRQVYGVDCLYVFLCIEPVPVKFRGRARWHYAAYTLNPRTLALGAEAFRRRLRHYAACKAEDRWPSYNEGLIREVDLPRYAEDL